MQRVLQQDCDFYWKNLKKQPVFLILTLQIVISNYLEHMQVKLYIFTDFNAYCKTLNFPHCFQYSGERNSEGGIVFFWNFDPPPYY